MLKLIGDLDSFNMIGMPIGVDIIQSAWVFKQKCYPGRRLMMYGSRSYKRGYNHVDRIDVFDTYASVVSWITVRLLLILF